MKNSSIQSAIQTWWQEPENSPGLANVINTAIPNTHHHNLKDARVVKEMVLNDLGFITGLSLSLSPLNSPKISLLHTFLERELPENG